MPPSRQRSSFGKYNENSLRNRQVEERPRRPGKFEAAEAHSRNVNLSEPAPSGDLVQRSRFVQSAKP